MKCWSKNCKLDHTDAIARVREEDLEARWDKNNTVCPYSAVSDDKVSLYCSKCSHFKPYLFSQFVRYSDVCYYCGQGGLCADEECDFCFEHSMASLESLEERWCTTNPDPRTVMLRTAKKVVLYCPDCDHVASIIGSHAAKNPWVCQYCDRTICMDENCDRCFSRSCASDPKLLKIWSPKNNAKPREVMKGTHKKFIFNCCNRDTLATPRRRTETLYKCPCCNQKSPPCGRPREECEKCYQKSFAACPAVKYYIGEYEIPAISISRFSRIKGWFKCDEGHKYDQQFANVNYGTGCPMCKRKGEKKMLALFIENYGEESVQREFKFQECRRTFCLPFDFFLFDKILVELDGAQHWRECPFFGGNLADRQAVDEYKNLCAKKKGFHLIRVNWEDFYHDRNNCTPNLLKVIRKLQKMDEPQFVKLYGGIVWDRDI